MPSRKEVKTMNELSSDNNREIPFSRRYTLREIWEYLHVKYDTDQSENFDILKENSPQQA